MAPLHSIHLDSLDKLRENAGAWDDLWQRSDATLPSLRAAMLAQWVEHFAKPEDFHAVAIECGGRWLAAMPFVRRKVGRVIDAGAMPNNEWAAGGELLLDVSSSDDAVAATAMNTLAQSLRELPWPLLWLDEAMLDAPRWLAFGQAVRNLGITVAENPHWRVGYVPIDRDWPAYVARWSRKHRQTMASSLRRLEQRGEVQLALHSQLHKSDVPDLMRQCFEIEDRSWKGAAGTSVLRTPRMAEFLIRQAELAAECGQLELAMLHCGGRAVAFSYGLSAKGVFHSIKVGYDPEYGGEHVGQLLRRHLLERFFADPDRRALDFQGPMTEAHAAWLPECYTVGRFAVAPRGLLARFVVSAYRNIWLRTQVGRS